MAVDALYDKVINPVMDFFKNIPQIIAGMMIDLGVPDWVTKKLFAEDTVKRANLERSDPVAYQRMVAAEQKLRDEQRAAERAARDNASVNAVTDNSTSIIKQDTRVVEERAAADAKKDSLSKKK